MGVSEKPYELGNVKFKMIFKMKNILLCFILLGLARTSFAQEAEEQIKKTITHEWFTYSKAFELKDYNKIAELFHCPVLLSGKSYSKKNGDGNI
jgi:hypothetical protein